MDELFGISMDTIMVWLVAIFAIAMSSILIIFLSNRVMFRMGVRNLPRRGLQTGLVVIGLMLATLITTAAFTTGDTVDYSISRAGYEQLQRTDLQLNFVGEDDIFTNEISVYVKESATAGLEQRFAGDPDIEGFIPLLIEPVPAVNLRSKQSEPSVIISGIDPQRLAKLGGLTLTNGNRADLAKLGPNEILLSKQGAKKLSAKIGDQISLHVNGSTTDVIVAGIVRDEMASSGTKEFFQQGSGGGAMLLSSVQKLTGHAGQINRLNVALKGDVATSYKLSESASIRLSPFLASSEGQQMLGVSNPVSVDAIKADTVEEAEAAGNLFTTFFLVLGLFSIAAGIMLIFMIFVMLATERKAEMGMARAVGAQRSSLVQSFLSEGMAYSVLAGAVGALFGVIAAVGLVAGFLKYAGGFDFIEAHITVRSLVVSYCLGVVVTFLTVVFSSFKISNVNIVAAIRGTDDDSHPRLKQRIAWKWVLGGIPALILPPIGLWSILRKGFHTSWSMILAPAGIALGLLSILAASSGGVGSQFLFSFGVSVLPLSFAAIASHYRANGRITWTLVGAYLAAYWLAPVDYADLILGKDLRGDIEMFLLSGVMVVISFTLIIVFNARLLTVLFQRSGKNSYGLAIGLAALTLACIAGGVVFGNSGDGTGQLLYLVGFIIGIASLTSFAAVLFPHLAPALKMGVAYPLSNRFRTGMTIAMFALIIFSLSAFSAINRSFVSLLTSDGGDGGWDVMATANRNSDIIDLETSLRRNNAAVSSDIQAYGRVTIFNGGSQVREVGKDYKTYPVLAADKGFFAMPDSRLQSWANGYDSERSVFDAVSGSTKLAIVDPSILPTGFNDYEFQVKNLKIKDDRFEPFDLEYRDVVSNREARVTVIGVLAIQVEPQYTAGVYVSDSTYQAVFGTPDYLRTYVKLNDKVNVNRAAQAIEASLVTQGVQSESIRQLLDDSVAQNNSFILMFQGFMGLGLFTGIAALGVIAYRSVVERRQQIGMLRAIGYQTGTVALTFMLESGFIALMGILSGVIGGMIIAHNLFTSGEFGGGIKFAIPWMEVSFIVITAFVVSMFMTWWPSRQAARVPVAEALRYE